MVNIVPAIHRSVTEITPSKRHVSVFIRFNWISRIVRFYYVRSPCTINVACIIWSDCVCIDIERKHFTCRAFTFQYYSNKTSTIRQLKRQSVWPSDGGKINKRHQTARIYRYMLYYRMTDIYRRGIENLKKYELICHGR